MTSQDLQDIGSTPKRNPVQGIVILTGIALVCFFALYSAYWVWYAGVVRQTLSSQINEWRQQDIIVENTPAVTGYPLPHKVLYSGDIQTPVSRFYIPELIGSGFALPGQDIILSLPEGLKWSVQKNIVDMKLGLSNTVLEIDRLSMRIGIPDNWPDDLTRRQVQAWQQKEPAITLKSMVVEKGPMTLKVKGHFYLNDDLQPEGEINLASRGHQEIIEQADERNLLTTREKSFLRTFQSISALSPSPEDEADILRLNVRVKDNRVFLGPLPVGRIPDIRWKTERID